MIFDWAEILSIVTNRRYFVMTSGSERLTLPVTPRSYRMQTAQDNKTVDILDRGELLLFGNAKLKKISFKSFFPALNHRYRFVVGDYREPFQLIDMISKWKEQKQAVRLIITDSPVNLMMAIMRFDYDERDGTRDIYYEMEMSEYRDLNIPASNYNQPVDVLTGLKNGRI